jgi:hypothetical protein
VFEKHTATKAGRDWQLLIVNSYSSHVNMAFLDWACRHQIIVSIMLSHSTYKLQLLDVGLFSLLSTAYLKQINNLMYQSLGLVSMLKRFFYQVFKEAWAKLFTKEHI